VTATATSPDLDLDALNGLLSRVTFRPHGGPHVPIRAERRPDGRVFLLHDLDVPDSRCGPVPGYGFKSRGFSQYRGSTVDEASIRRELTFHVASTSAHEALEWLTLDGDLLHDPHRDGEPLAMFAPPGIPDGASDSPAASAGIDSPWRLRDLLRLLVAAWRLHRRSRATHRSVTTEETTCVRARVEQHPQSNPPTMKGTSP